jgi:predicted phage terminase large subunit-like protein
MAKKTTTAAAAPIAAATHAPPCPPKPAPKPITREDAMREAAATLSRFRIERGRVSPVEFMRTYLPSYAQQAFSPMHLEVASLIAQGTQQRGMRLAIAAPRGHAKSTLITLATVLWCIAYKLESYIIIVCDTQDQAIGHLRSIREQIESNRRLQEDFPHACLVPPATRRPQIWRRTEIVTGNDVRIAALGSNTKVRGRRHNEARPGLIIADDIENEAMVRSPEQREQLAEWFNGALLKAGDTTTNIIAIGTILHYDSLLATITDTVRSPGWQGRTYRAIESWADHEHLWDQWRSIYTGQVSDGPIGPAAARAFFEANQAEMLEGTKVLWPERESYEQLMVMRLTEGAASFDAEKQNQPVDPEKAFFKEREFTYWDDRQIGEAELLGSLKGPLEYYAACDPSLGRAGRHNDDTAIIVVVRDRATGVVYVLEADISKRTPSATIDHLIELGRRRRLNGLAIESNQFQQFLADEVIRRSTAAGVSLPVRKISHTTDKIGRIQSLQPRLVNGTIRLCRRHRKLIDQLIQFPFAAHDDGPDALALVMEVMRGVEIYVTDLDAIDSVQDESRQQSTNRRMLEFLHGDDD